MILKIGSDTVTPVLKVDPVLFIGSGQNPALTATYTLTINLKDDTAYSTTTPSTTSQTVFTEAQADYRTTGSTIDMTKGWLVVEDILIPHKYTSQPSVINTECVAVKSVYSIGRRYNSSTNSANYNVINLVGTVIANRYRSATGATHYYGATAAYAVGTAAVAPTLSSTSSATPTIYLPNPKMTIRTSSTYMASGAWANLDSENVNMNVRWQFYQVDAPSCITTAYEIAKNMVLNEQMQSNLVLLGDN